MKRKIVNKKINKNILSYRDFSVRLLRYSLFSLSLLIFSLGIGTGGYYYYANLNLVDSFYNASMILTGMGPADRMPTDAAKIFSSIYALFSGIAFLTTFAIFISPIVHRLLHILHIEDDDY